MNKLTEQYMAEVKSYLSARHLTLATNIVINTLEAVLDSDMDVDEDFIRKTEVCLDGFKVFKAVGEEELATIGVQCREYEEELGTVHNDRMPVDTDTFSGCLAAINYGEGIDATIEVMKRLGTTERRDSEPPQWLIDTAEDALLKGKLAVELWEDAERLACKLIEDMSPTFLEMSGYTKD